MRLCHGDHEDSVDNRDNITVTVIMRTVMIIVTITVTLLVKHFHCRSDPRLKEMLAKFNIYVENVGGGSVSLKKQQDDC